MPKYQNSNATFLAIFKPCAEHGATNNTTNLDLLSKQTPTKTPEPQTSSQITDYCVVQKRKRRC